MTFEEALVALSNNTAIDIDLTGEALSKAQILELCSALASNVSLQRLCLEEVGLEADGVAALAKVLAYHPAIQRLELDENLLGEKGIAAIINLFNHHPTLYKVSASVGTGASKFQRNTLKQYNKQYKARKSEQSTTIKVPQTSDTSQNPLLETIISTYYDRAWNGQQLMADPVFYPKDGKIYERERLVAQQQDVGDGHSLVTATTQQQHIRQYLSKKAHLWHQPKTGVYIPEQWQQGVLAAIKTGDSQTLQTYWQQHPGLVTTLYPLGEHQVRLHEVFIRAGQLGDFQQWLMRYSQYTQYDTVPGFITLFSDIHDGQHSLHHLVNHNREPEWYAVIAEELQVSGDIYHGLVHLQSSVTVSADTAAINSLLAHQQRPMAGDEDGYTPLMLALVQGKYVIAELLLPYSELNAQDSLGNTALHHAVNQPANNARDHCIVNLLGRGINDTLTNKDGQTAEALLEAKESRHYRTLLRALKNKQRGRLQGLEEKVITLEQSLTSQQQQLEESLTSQQQQQKQLEQSLTSQQQLEATFNKQLQTLIKYVDTLSQKVIALDTENAELKALSTQRATQLKTVLADEKVQAKFYAPKKEYLRHLFLASTPEIAQVDKGLKGVAEKLKKAHLDRQDRLIEACSTGDLALVKQLHKSGASLDDANRAGDIPLVAACRARQVAVIDYIDTHSRQVEQSWMAVKQVQGEAIHELQKQLPKLVHISETTTYGELAKTIRELNDAAPDDHKSVKYLKKLIIEWDLQWNKIATHHLFDSRYYSYAEMSETCKFLDRAVATRITYRRHRCHDEDEFPKDVASARSDLQNYVNQCIDELNLLVARLPHYISRMEDCADLFEAGGNNRIMQP